MTVTPRTDKEVRKIWSEDYAEEVVAADFARKLEKEIAKLELENEQLIDEWTQVAVKYDRAKKELRKTQTEHTRMSDH